MIVICTEHCLTTPGGVLHYCTNTEQGHGTCPGALTVWDRRRQVGHGHRQVQGDNAAVLVSVTVSGLSTRQPDCPPVSASEGMQGTVH